jgi:thiol-disulfide isomerase/thioredoxin
MSGSSIPLEIAKSSTAGLRAARLTINRNRYRGETKTMRSFITNAACMAAAAFSMTAGASAENLEGRWAATVTQAGVAIPFRLDITGEGDHVIGTLYNGDDKETTTSATIRDGKVQLNFEHYLTSISAEVKNGELDGKIINSRRVGNVDVGGGGAAAAPARTGNRRNGANVQPGEEEAARVGSAFHASRYVAPTAASVANVPSIDGVWEIPHDSPKGEKAWRLIVQQHGADITTTILRVDGDTGALTGSWQGDKFVASHFDGARPGLFELKLLPDGNLQVDNKTTGPRGGMMVAYRPEVARAKGLPEPANYLTHTSVRDPQEVFAYSFPDIHGKVVSNTDPKFQGKVVLAIVTGTWCPNCHDEAQYLVQLYNKYHDQGLEIVAIDFEEPDQQTSLTRVNAFIKQYKVPYTYLIAGAPADMWDKVPQAVNLNTWPATLFIGRDGKVKATHAGFASPASGVFNAQLKQEFTSNIERLLRENREQRSE